MLKNALSSITDGLISLTYPQDCRICSQPVNRWNDGVACDRCWSDQSLTKLFFNTTVCTGCGNPLPRTRSTSQDLFCGRCDARPFTAARACGWYSGAIESSVICLKSHPWVPGRLRRIAVDILVEHQDTLHSDLIVPIPLHRSRYKERGFNQARLIAQLASKVYRTGIDDTSMVRVIDTDRHRSGMDARDRAKSVDRAFEVRRPKAVEGRSVLLVDDVFTTGSTAAAASRSLLDAGAAQVRVFTLARVPARW